MKCRRSRCANEGSRHCCTSPIVSLPVRTDSAMDVAISDDHVDLTGRSSAGTEADESPRARGGARPPNEQNGNARSLAGSAARQRIKRFRQRTRRESSRPNRLGEALAAFARLSGKLRAHGVTGFLASRRQALRTTLFAALFAASSRPCARPSSRPSLRPSFCPFLPSPLCIPALDLLDGLPRAPDRDLLDGLPSRPAPRPSR